MINWVDETLAAERKKGFLVLSFPAIQKMGITVKDLIGSSDLPSRFLGGHCRADVLKSVVSEIE